MSDAKVEIDDDTFTFACPKVAGRRCGPLFIRGKCGLPHDPQNQNGGYAQWTIEGQAFSATITPSIDCKGCWHGHIRNGRCVDTSDRDEPEPK